MRHRTAPPPGNTSNKLDAEAVDQLLLEHFPQLRIHGKLFIVEELSPRAARMRMARHESQLRPGGTVSGPAMFQLADLALYVALLGEIGVVAIPAVTGNLNIVYLSRPAPADVIATARLLAINGRIVVGEIELHSAGADDLIAHATGTYVLPVGTR